MARAVLYLFAFVLLFGVVRAILGIVAKFFKDIVNTASSNEAPRADGVGAAPRGAPLPKSEELKRDPVCGTYLAPSTAVEKIVGGKTYYFCSTECRDKFRG